MTETKNKMFPAECAHLSGTEFRPVATVTIATLPEMEGTDFQYVTGPDVMKICAFCQGALWSTMGMFPIAGKHAVSAEDVAHKMGHALAALFDFHRNPPK